MLDAMLPASSPISLAAAALSLVSSGIATTAAATPVAPLAMEPPRGYADLCDRQPALCDAFAGTPAETPRIVMTLPIAALSFRLPRLDPPSPVPLDRQTQRREAKLLAAVNAGVNASVAQRPDQEVYGTGEYWTRSGTGPGARGDCEDIAIEKRVRLIAAGFAPDRLSFGVVFSRAAGLHVVLLARTGKGVMALDSRNHRIMAADKIRYRWLSVQDWREPSLWLQPNARGARA